MNDSAPLDRDYWVLIDDSFNEALGAGDLHRLEAQLAGNVDLQRSYLRLCRMHADLRLIAGARRAVERTRLLLETDRGLMPPLGSPAAEPPLFGSSLWQVLTDGSTWTNRFVWAGALGIAVSIYGVFGLLVWSMSKPPVREEVRLATQSEAASSPVAQINESADSTWERGHGPRDAQRSDSEIKQYQLTQGIAEIVLAQGAHVTLSGPATFDVLSANSGYLHRGKLRALAPPQAVGFTVETDRATIVDRGTEFGVEVDDQGTAEIHVLHGKVDVAATDRSDPRGKPSATGEPVRLERNEAVRVGADKSVQKITFKREHFAVAPSTFDPVAARLPGQSPGLRLWLRADRGVRLDATGNVEDWSDQSRGGYDAGQSEPARRPRWLPSTDTLATAVIRFDGVDDVLESARGLDFDQAADGTLLLLVSHVDCTTKNLGLFSLCSRNLADWNSPDGFALATSQSGTDRLAAAAAATGPPAAPDDSLQMDAELPAPGPYLLTVTKKSGTATFRVNGTTTAIDRYRVHSDDSHSSMQTAGYRVGARSEGGGQVGPSLFAAFDVTEILVYDRALSSDESRGIEAYLQNRSRGREARSP